MGCSAVWLILAVSPLIINLLVIEVKSQCTTGAIRLVGGSSPNEGRVEVCVSGQWGTVCDDYWGNSDARVVCRQLGYTTNGSTAFRNAHFGPGSGNIFMDDVHCSGSESQLRDCPSTSTHDCGNHEDASVQCQTGSGSQCSTGDLRLVGGSSPNEGRVEVCVSGEWGTVCDDSWDDTDAQVVCRQLGYTTDGSTAFRNAHFGPGSGNIFFDSVHCSGSESRLRNCPHISSYHDCYHNEDASVQCQTGIGVCFQTTSYTAYHSQSRIVSTLDYTRCGLQNWCSKVVYRASYTIEAYIANKTEPVCCTGYSGNGVTCTQIPLKGPSGLSVNRTEATVAVVMWEPLSIEHLRGNLSSYEIVYYEVSDEQCPQNTTTDHKTVSVDERESMFSITELDPGLQYCVGVAAKTSAEVGEFSYSFIPWYVNNVFTLALMDTARNCTQWRLGSEDVMEIAHGVSQGIELICHCNFPSVYIADEKLTCDEENPHLAIFRGHIISTNDRASSDLLGDLEEWVSSGPTVVVQGKELRVVSSETSPNPSSDDKDNDEEQDSNLLGVVVGTVVPVIILLLLVSAVVIGIFLFRWRVKRVKGNDIYENLTSTSSNPAEAEDDDHVLREFSNTLYGSVEYAQTPATDPEYQMPRPMNQVQLPEDVYNPTYGLSTPHNTPAPDTETSAGYTEPSGVYSEVTADREANVYDVPGWQ